MKLTGKPSGLSAWCAVLLMVTSAAGPVGAQGLVEGIVAAPRGADLAMINLSNGQMDLLTLPSDALISMVAWSPDSTRIAASRASRPPGEAWLGQDIDILDAGSGELLSSITRDASGIILDSPSWSPDGQWIYYERQETQQFAFDVRVERAHPDGSERAVILEKAHGPSLSADGTSMLFVRTEQGESLWRAKSDGSEPRQIVAQDRFIAIMYPRFAPDGQALAFAAVGDPLRQPGPTPRSTPGTSRALGSIVPIPVIGRRHGIPWDIWVGQVDGTDLHAVRLGQDDPSIAWSADGANLAVFGGLGLELVDRSGTSRRITTEVIGFGGIDWKR